MYLRPPSPEVSLTHYDHWLYGCFFRVVNHSLPLDDYRVLLDFKGMCLNIVLHGLAFIWYLLLREIGVLCAYVFRSVFLLTKVEELISIYKLL